MEFVQLAVVHACADQYHKKNYTLISVIYVEIQKEKKKIKKNPC